MQLQKESPKRLYEFPSLNDLLNVAEMHAIHLFKVNF